MAISGADDTGVQGCGPSRRGIDDFGAEAIARNERGALDDTIATIQSPTAAEIKHAEAIARNERGALDDTIATIQSLTADLERAKAALAESEKRLKEAQQLANLGSWTLDLVTGQLYWSDEVYRIFELAPHLFNGSLEGFLTAIHPDDRDAVANAYDESVKEHRPYSIEHRLLMPDGRIKYVQERSVTQYEAGRAVRSIGTVQDITKEKQAALERASLEVQLQQAQRLEAIGRLAGGVAHDFNNMLGVILGYGELALGDLPANHPVCDSLNEINKAARRSKELTTQLLAFARRQTIAPRVMTVNDAIEAMLKMLQRLIGEDIELMWRPAQALWSVEVDPGQLDQILVNLCVNARDAIANVGKITIETANATFDADYCATHLGFSLGDYVRLSVSDNGCGMDRETLQHIFEPFFTTKAVGTGTGLGLATVYGVVRQNNGFINVYSEPEAGTTFAIYLPRHLGDEAPIHAASISPASLHGVETILLIEDEPALLSMFSIILTKYGYTVLAARTPTEAIELARSHANEIGLMVSDVVMPEMNGRELAGQIATHIPNIKRLFMSGYTANVIAHHNVLDRGVSFIQKPFSEKDLVLKVREVLASGESPRPSNR